MRSEFGGHGEARRARAEGIAVNSDVEVLADPAAVARAGADFVAGRPEPRSRTTAGSTSR